MEHEGSYRIHKSQTLVLILSQMQLIHNFQPHFL